MATRSKKFYREQGFSDKWLRIDKRVYDSIAWNVLSPSAKDIWLRVRTLLYARGGNNGVLAPTWSECVKRGWMISNERRIKGLKELVAAGFLAHTRYCGPNTFHRASLYRFTDIPCPENDQYGVAGCGPTDDYKKPKQPAVTSKRRPPIRQKKNASTDRPSYERDGTPSYEPNGTTVDGGRKRDGPTVDANRRENALTAGPQSESARDAKTRDVDGQTVIALEVNHSPIAEEEPADAGSAGSGSAPSLRLVLDVVERARPDEIACERPTNEFQRARLKYERRAASLARAAAKKQASRTNATGK